MLSRDWAQNRSKDQRLLDLDAMLMLLFCKLLIILADFSLNALIFRAKVYGQLQMEPVIR